MTAAHGEQWFTGGRERAAAAIRAWSVHGKVARDANDISVISYFC
jgi:hypothetical protein